MELNFVSAFSEPVEGLEAPWGMAQLTFFADSKNVTTPPKRMPALLDFAKANPGRVTYPRPRNFHGMTFIKQALVEVNTDRAALYKPVTPEALAKAGTPLWAYLDAQHPHLWRVGKQFVQNAAATRLIDTVANYQFTIGNTHFLAIPYNAKAKEGAQVLAKSSMSCVPSPIRMAGGWMHWLRNGFRGMGRVKGQLQGTVSRQLNFAHRTERR